MNTKNETLLTIVYYTLEAIIDIREGDFKMLTVMRNYFHKDNIQPQIQQILENIYQIGQNKEINNYLLKLLLVIIRTLGQNTAGYTGPFTAMYQNQLDKLIKGYTFQSSFLIFESIGTLINYSCKVYYFLVNFG